MRNVSKGFFSVCSLTLWCLLSSPRSLARHICHFTQFFSVFFLFSIETHKAIAYNIFNYD